MAEADVIEQSKSERWHGGLLIPYVKCFHRSSPAFAYIEMLAIDVVESESDRFTLKVVPAGLQVKAVHHRAGFYLATDIDECNLLLDWCENNGVDVWFLKKGVTGPYG